ncbi:uncharacterized protein AB675_9816 [Cyphellophora attinorum]|uniref:Uncharacterized protein n=1 Tax=Cyphellophora attinorum TaxID=1664694 RepID=A0A0N1HDI6_9EURO|nr:uncharacterized protein AB675_9816 [Phialophora attinorum]KPI42490.1 hypothetical protein AB675_9816 [Phialophora attinorum]
MAFQDEIPNSQPSSPAVSPWYDGTDENETTDRNDYAEATTLNLNAEVADAHNAVRGTSDSITAPTKHTDQQPESPVPNHQDQDSSLKPTPPRRQDTSPVHKPPSTITKHTSASQGRRSSARRVQHQHSYTPAYLRSRIALLLSSLESTHADLTSTLAEFEKQLKLELSSTINGQSAPTDTASPTEPPSHKQPLTLTPEQTILLARASTTLQSHVNRLGKYNAVKDIAMGMLGMIAEREGKTVRAVMLEREVGLED